MTDPEPPSPADKEPDIGDSGPQGSVPELPGGPVSDTALPPVAFAEVSDSSTAPPLPGGDVADTRRDPVTLTPQDRRLAAQEFVRGGLAFSFILLFTLVAIFGFTQLGKKGWADAKDYLDILVPAVSALLGSATGFYFATKK